MMNDEWKAPNAAPPHSAFCIHHSAFRIFCYLKPFKALPDLLSLLNESRCPTLAYVDGLSDEVRRRHESPTLRLARGRQDLAAAARQCDLAVLNAGQGSTAAMLLAGVPLLLVPLVLEQSLTARAVERLGAGLRANPNDPADVAAKLAAMLGEQFHPRAAAARAFADRYASLDPNEQIERMADRVEELLAARKPRGRTPVFAG